MAGEPTLYARMELRIRDFEKAIDRANSKADSGMRRIESRTAAASKRIESSLTGMFKSFGGGILAGAAGAFSVQGAQQLLDAAKRIQNSLKTAGLEGQNLAKVYDQLFASAQKNGAPIESLVQLYSKLSLVSGELGVKQQDLVKFTDNVAVALRAGGTDAQAASGALLQLTQALGGGVVRAEEFNSILEGAPTILQQAAAGLEEANGSVAKLRQIMLDGELSSKAFFDAFQAGAPIMAERASSAELTISQAFVRLQNVMIDAAKKFDDASGASKAFAGALESTANYIETVDFQNLISQIDAVSSAFNRALGDAQNFARGIAEATGGAGIGDYLASTPFGEAIGIRKDINTRIRQGDATAPSNSNSALQEALRRRYGGGSVAAPKSDRLTAEAIDAKAAEAIKKVSIKDYEIPATGKSGKAAASKINQAAQKAATQLNNAIANQTGVAVDVVTQFLGQNEKTNRGSINSFLKAGGVDLDAAQKAWCAAFVNSALSQVGVKGSGSNIATDFLNWGQGVSANQVQRGDVLVQSRGKSAGETGGHVGFATGQVRFQDGILQLQQISGNAANQVKEQWINASDTVVRRATEAMQLPADGLRNLSEASKQAIDSSTDALTQQQQAYQQLGQIGTTVMNGLANALADGKIEGSELLQILMQVVQQLMSMSGIGGMGGGGGGGFLSMLFGGGFGGGSIASGIAGPWGASLHSGGRVGRSGGHRRRINPAWYSNAPVMHSGGNIPRLRHDEVPAVLQRGETVIPRGGMGGREGSNHFNTRIQVRVDGNSARVEGDNRTALAKDIAATIDQRLVYQSRPGGLIWNNQRRKN